MNNDKQVKLLPELTGEEFFNNKDSVYLRCTYDKAKKGFKVLIFNNMETDRIGEDEVKLAILVRGLAEVALESPVETFQLGYEASIKDHIDLSSDLSDEEKDLLSHPVGNA